MPTRDQASRVDRPGFGSGPISVDCPSCRAAVPVETGEQFSGALIDCDRCGLPFYLAPNPSGGPKEPRWQLVVPRCEDLAPLGNL